MSAKKENQNGPKNLKNQNKDSNDECDNLEKLEQELLKIDQELEETGDFYFRKSSPSTMKSQVKKVIPPLKTPSTVDSMILGNEIESH